MEREGGGKEQRMMNDFWTATVTPRGRRPPNETWQNGDICRNIGYSLGPQHIALSLSRSPAALVLIVYGHWSIYFNWHFLPGPGVLNLAGVIYILLLIRKRKKETNPRRHGSGKGEKALYKTEMWQTLNWIVCEGEREREREMRLVEKTRVSGIEREASVISHLAHREKANISSACWYEWWVLPFKGDTTEKETVGGTTELLEGRWALKEADCIMTRPTPNLCLK